MRLCAADARVCVFEQICCRWKNPQTGEWEKHTWAEVNAAASLIAKGLVHAGAQPLDRVAVVSSSSPAYLATVIASATLGTVLVPVYEDLDAEGVCWQLCHSGASFIFVEDARQLAKLLRMRHKLTAARVIVQFIGGVSERAAAADETLFDLHTFVRTGEFLVTDALLARWGAKIQPGQTAVLAYTSGKTAVMKAAMLSHDAVSWTARQLAKAIGLGASEVFLSYLTLGSISNLLLDVYVAAYVGAQVCFGSGDQAGSQVLQLLQEVRPTAFLAVPRVWEDLHRACLGANAAAGAEQREPLGLSRCHWAASTGALLATPAAEFFAAAGVPVYQLYGAVETCGVVTVGSAVLSHANEFGAPLGALDIDVLEANKDNEGVLLVRGRNLFSGYYRDEMATRSRVTDEGFFNTGDMFRMEGETVYIFGHKKELLRVPGDEAFVAPAPIETLVKQALPFVSDVLVLGNGLSFLSALVAIKSDVEGTALPSANVSTHAADFLHAAQVDETAIAKLVANDKVKAIVDQRINEYNAGVAEVCRIKKWSFLPRPFSVEGLELTPTLKPKRRVVARMYAKLIDSFYAGEPAYSGADQVVGLAAVPSPSKKESPAKAGSPASTAAGAEASSYVASGSDTYGGYANSGSFYGAPALQSSFGVYPSVNNMDASFAFGGPAQFFYPPFNNNRMAMPMPYDPLQSMLGGYGGPGFAPGAGFGGFGGAGFAPGSMFVPPPPMFGAFPQYFPSNFFWPGFGLPANTASTAAAGRADDDDDD